MLVYNYNVELLGCSEGEGDVPRYWMLNFSILIANHVGFTRFTLSWGHCPNPPIQNIGGTAAPSVPTPPRRWCHYVRGGYLEKWSG